MEPLRRIEALIEPALAAQGYELVRVRLTGNVRRTLQVMIERSDARPMAVDDCAAASAALSALLDVEDPIEESYLLEVSSPGIDRPLVRARDFERYAGFDARVHTHQPINGRRRFRGRLLGATGGCVRLTCDNVDVAIRLEDIADAKLILTDELIAAYEGERGPKA